MREPSDGGSLVKSRLVLGFDGGCSACAELARRVREQTSSGKLEVLSLREPPVDEWRAKTLGERSPLLPTLFEAKGLEVRAYTGWRLGARLARTLGPAEAWRIVRTLGEAGGEIGGSPAAQLPLGPAASSLGPILTRGRFLKGVGGAVVAASLLSAPAGFASPAAAAVETPIRGTRVGDAAVGATIPRPEDWAFERERFTSEGTYGFSLWKPEEDSSNRDGGEPVVRVALALDLSSEDIERAVKARLDEYRDLPMKREQVRVGAQKLKGEAVGPIPGSTPSTEVYVTFEGRVYQINVYGEELTEEGRRLLLGLEFSGARATATASLGLPDGADSEAFWLSGEAEELAEREKAARESALAPPRSEAGKRKPKPPPPDTGGDSYAEYQIYEGCWTASSAFFFQTQHGMYANGRSGDGIGTGYTIVGRPNFWGQYTHGNLGYGRCTSQIYTNDKFAIDYPLAAGDVVFSPFKSGTVTFAGRNYTHKDYGLFVIIKAGNGKYVSMSAHLSGLASGIRKGATVTDATIIGYAGNTGGPDIPVGEPHLHQAFYRYPRYNADGTPYGGAGLQAVFHRYVGTAAGTGPGVYKFGWSSSATTKSEGDYISN